jgi:hypothetical protein
MKRIILLNALLCISFIAYTQFEQTFSFNFSLGSFKNFGKRFSNVSGAFQMPNYKPGIAVSAGFQYNTGSRLAFSIEAGFIATNNWNYKTPDKPNYLSWTVNAPVTDSLLEEGEDYLDLRNFYAAARIKYYLKEDKKWIPYLFAGVTLNKTSCWFENNLWYALEKWGQLEPGDTEPWNDYLEENFGVGFHPGFGLEFTPANRLHLYLETGYYFIALNKENFKDQSRAENYNSLLIQAGLRLNFIKSKDL